ncbi:MAG: gliding motility-associated C-terminal domain-containing protein [Bacteroidota bacterium]
MVAHRTYNLYVAFGLFVFAFSSVLHAQNEATNWHFGDSIVVSFATGEPVRLLPTSMITEEGCASISDASGDLLFYTNGGGRIPDSSGGQNPGTIWNRNNEIMYDMMGVEGGGFSSEQSSIIFSDPSNASNYYLFTMEENEFDFGGNPDSQPQGRGLSYFIIDMSLNGGLGGVSLADQRVFVPSFEGLAATPNSDDSGFWVFAYGENEGDIVVVNVDAAGVGLPNVQNLGIPLGGTIKVSPDGQIVAIGNDLFEFDNNTGVFGSVVISFLENSTVTHSFTPDSRYYFSSFSNSTLGRRIVRYDLEAADIAGSRLDIAILPSQLSTQQMQIAPNGNLYFLENDLLQDQTGLSEIVCPSGLIPIFNRRVLTFDDADNPFFGLPNFVDAIFRNLATEDTTVLEPISLTICAGDSINARQPGQTYQWSTDEETFNIVPESSGEYEVTITTDCGVTIDRQIVTVDQVPEAEIRALVPEGGSCPDEEIDLFVLSEPAPDSVIWQNSITTNILSIIAQPDSFITATAFYDCGSVVLEYTVPDFSPEFMPRLVVDQSTDLCPGEEVTLTITGDNIAAVDWSTGESDLSIIIPSVDSSETYSANVSGLCDRDTVLEASINFEGCPVVCLAEFPDIITPNGDGRNDLFRIFTNCPVEDYQLTIFNRWGQEVFSTDQPDVQGWDGTKDGEPQPMEGYLYIATFRFGPTEEAVQFDGQFTLIR